MKLMIVLKASALAVTFAVSGCATTEFREVRPQCTPPSEPALPLIDRGELWDALGDDRYRELERYLNTLWGYADEQAAMLDSLCETSPADGLPAGT
ncbi:hypothetical protein [Halomonas rhizosphaerae]|uniref:Uncharacterized protein n=1 Tax=Halomonas rhizosphaerae TaxID=3043296 RepID=A0ABT6V0Z5_9GAMM|nr:hypothetical protein [Halomonas rhizosphaerae]MDI5890617.1 hypothetical protein [Halomonas rhizosphaerae]